eukprot:Awhi_evm1s4895
MTLCVLHSSLYFTLFQSSDGDELIHHHEEVHSKAIYITKWVCSFCVLLCALAAPAIHNNLVSETPIQHHRRRNSSRSVSDSQQFESQENSSRKKSDKKYVGSSGNKVNGSSNKNKPQSKVSSGKINANVNCEISVSLSTSSSSVKKSSAKKSAVKKSVEKGKQTSSSSSKKSRSKKPTTEDNISNNAININSDSDSNGNDTSLSSSEIALSRSLSNNDIVYTAETNSRSNTNSLSRHHLKESVIIENSNPPSNHVRNNQKKRNQFSQLEETIQSTTTTTSNVDFEKNSHVRHNSSDSKSLVGNVEIASMCDENSTNIFVPTSVSNPASSSSSPAQSSSSIISDFENVRAASLSKKSSSQRSSHASKIAPSSCSHSTNDNNKVKSGTTKKSSNSQNRNSVGNRQTFACNSTVSPSSQKVNVRPLNNGSGTSSSNLGLKRPLLTTPVSISNVKSNDPSLSSTLLQQGALSNEKFVLSSASKQVKNLSYREAASVVTTNVDSVVVNRNNNPVANLNTSDISNGNNFQSKHCKSNRHSLDLSRDSSSISSLFSTDCGIFSQPASPNTKFYTDVDSDDSTEMLSFTPKGTPVTSPIKSSNSIYSPPLNHPPRYLHHGNSPNSSNPMDSNINNASPFNQPTNSHHRTQSDQSSSLYSKAPQQPSMPGDSLNKTSPYTFPMNAFSGEEMINTDSF